MHWDKDQVKKVVLDYVFYDRDRDLFYTQGDKIIQFDSKGKFTGKEIRIAYRDKGIEGKIASGLKMYMLW